MLEHLGEEMSNEPIIMKETKVMKIQIILAAQVLWHDDLSDKILNENHQTEGKKREEEEEQEESSGSSD